MKQTKLRQSARDPRAIGRALFNPPFSPQVNFALEDPLLLSTHKEVQKNGLSFTTYFGAGSALSAKASEFIKVKQSIERQFAESLGREQSLILPFTPSAIERISRSFLPSQVVLTTPDKQKEFEGCKVHLFSTSDLYSLKSLLETSTFDHKPVVFLPTHSKGGGALDLALLAKWKSELDFFLIVEDAHRFGLVGFDGFGSKRLQGAIDLLVTHIPKTFGKTLTVLSGNGNILETLMEYSFFEASLFFAPCYLGMLAAMLEIIPDLKDRREKLLRLEKKLLFTLGNEIHIDLPLLSFYVESEEERIHFTKTMVDKGFLLPAFSSNSAPMQLFLNYTLEEKSIGQLSTIFLEKKNHTICESI